MNTNNEGTYSNYQDKYFLKKQKDTKGENEFETLAGNRINVGDVNHNNMNIYLFLTKVYWLFTLF